MKPLFFLLFLFSFPLLRAQHANPSVTREHYAAITLAAQYHARPYMEAGLFYAFEKGLGSEGASTVYGPTLSAEFPLRGAEGRTNVTGLKAGFALYRWMGWCGRFNYGYYTNGKQASSKLCPELGFNLLDGIFGVLYGYNFPLNNPGLADNNRNHFTIIINIPFYFKTFYGDGSVKTSCWGDGDDD